MAKLFAYKSSIGGPIVFVQTSDAVCDSEYGAAVGTGYRVDGVTFVQEAWEYPNAVLNGANNGIASFVGQPKHYTNPFVQSLGVSANSAFLGPVSGNPAQPAFRTFVPADMSIPILATVLANGANSNIPVNNASLLRVTGPSGAFNITGFVAGVDGQELDVYNTTTQVLTIIHDATSTAANRIFCATGANIAMAASKGVARFVYSAADSRWICISPLA